MLFRANQEASSRCSAQSQHHKALFLPACQRLYCLMSRHAMTPTPPTCALRPLVLHPVPQAPVAAVQLPAAPPQLRVPRRQAVSVPPRLSNAVLADLQGQHTRTRGIRQAQGAAPWGYRRGGVLKKNVHNLEAGGSATNSTAYLPSAAEPLQSHINRTALIVQGGNRLSLAGTHNPHTHTHLHRLLQVGRDL